MSFMLKKKKYKFKVDLTLQELSDVTFVNGIIFAKIRLIDGGTFTELSQKLVIYCSTVFFFSIVFLVFCVFIKIDCLNKSYCVFF